MNIEPFREMFGVLPEREIARRAGVWGPGSNGTGNPLKTESHRWQGFAQCVALGSTNPASSATDEL
ncbi:hypothetical protein [Pseudomonas amygdali]|uniref:hypothetical protein n=1 Tax=Pseudomonas amygdali TaxID=47877 RepID=UPI000A490F6F|nr:hypothetical protein [Pseudomonas amygdali]